MPRFHGVGPRIAQRLIGLGCVRADGKPDVARFALEHRYDKTVFYEWIGDRSTPTKEIDRLCTDLGVTKAWLLLAEGVDLLQHPPSSVTPAESAGRGATGTTLSKKNRTQLKKPMRPASGE